MDLASIPDYSNPEEDKKSKSGNKKAEAPKTQNQDKYVQPEEEAAVLQQLLAGIK